ncbi:ABC transporter ATP-binding protein [Nitratireductor thuwali]|uniref:ABC transporter ATP-binding protein n=1 Tax=Nitratireductor thuwali TaxID=2267699 RepID=UPI0030D0DD3B
MTFQTARGEVRAVENVSIDIERGATYAFVGESGSGKTATCLGLARLLQSRHRLTGSAAFDGFDLATADERTLAAIHGRRIGFVFQDAAGRLDPLRNVKSHFLTTTRRLLGLRGPAALARILESLRNVGLFDVEAVLAKFPHELSGGMAQRVMIALALVGNPDLIIADEPTTALDAGNRLTILSLLTRLARQHSASLILVTHDLKAASFCDVLAVFYAGQVVEIARIDHGYDMLRHPYSRALLRAAPHLAEEWPARPIPGTMPAHGERGSVCRFAPRCSARRIACMNEPLTFKEDRQGGVLCQFPMVEESFDEATELISAGETRGAARPVLSEPVLELDRVSKAFHARSLFGFGRKRLGGHALLDVSLVVHKGECLALVGESGSGKSTICNLVLGMCQPSAGRVNLRIDGEEPFAGAARKSVPRVQMIFQDPQSAFDPRIPIGEQVAEPLRVNGIGTAASRLREARAMFDTVRLEHDFLSARPRQLSGGQLQRAAIARALILRPQLLVCDEPTSALDVSVQCEIVNLFGELKRSMGLAMLFVTHDLAAIRPIADRIAVMRAGEIVEEGSTAQIIAEPRHPYTQNLIDLSGGLSLGRADAQDRGRQPDLWPLGHDVREGVVA